MKIIEALHQKKSSLSFEFFPPKDSKMEDDLYKTVDLLQPLKPSFVSVTYGAMGSTQEKTFELAVDLKKRFSIETMAHITCIGSTEKKIAGILCHLHSAGVENILALRGDFPEGYTASGELCDFHYAYQLVHFIRRKYNVFSIGVAGYPEGHPECRDMEKSIDYLKMKTDEGADFIITQLFFLNDHFFRFADLLHKRGVNVPVIIGIMPLTNSKQITIFEEKCGAFVPAEIKNVAMHYGEDAKAMREFGIAYATRQCEELIRMGFQRFHFYTFNRSTSTMKICQNIGLGGE